MGRIADAKSPAQAKKIVIPAFVSKSWIEFRIGLRTNRCEQQKIWTAGCAGRTCQLIIVIPIWMGCSISVILYNSESPLASRPCVGSALISEYVFTGLNFPFPVFLTTWHLTFSVCTDQHLTQAQTHYRPSLPEFCSEQLRSLMALGISR